MKIESIAVPNISSISRNLAMNIATNYIYNHPDPSFEKRDQSDDILIDEICIAFHKIKSSTGWYVRGHEKRLNRKAYHYLFIENTSEIFDLESSPGRYIELFL